MADPLRKTGLPIHVEKDSTANENTKSWTVPDGQVWKILCAHVSYTSTATGGNRQLVLKVEDESSDVILDTRAGAVQAASLTRDYSFMQGIYRETAFTADEIQVPVPSELYVGGGSVLTIYDSADIDSNDDFTAAISMFRYTV